MQRCLLIVLLSALGCFVQSGIVAAEGATTDGSHDDYVGLAETFNPVFQAPYRLPGEKSGWKDSPDHNVLVRNSFVNPASDVAKKSQELAWFSFYVFLPFLVLPQVLLLVVIFKFRDRKDGRKAATFVHNDKLEITWTAIPCVALIIVAIPLTKELYRVDNPPANEDIADPLVVKVIGKQFAWEYKLPDHDIKLGSDMLFGNGSVPGQETIVFEKDRLTTLFFTSNDVNHAWSVPAFGVRKDCFISRENKAWFTPDTNGAYEGQCYELCGAGHGLMLFDAVVTDHDTFNRWVWLMQNKTDAKAVVDVLYMSLRDGDAKAKEEAAAKLGSEVNTYLSTGNKQRRADALRYWTAVQWRSLNHQANIRGDSATGDAANKEGAIAFGLIKKHITEQLAMLDSESPALARLDEEVAQ